MFRIFTNQAANGNSASFFPKNIVPAEGLSCELHVWGTFGSGNVTLQQSPDGGTTWHNVSSAISTAGRTVVTVYSAAPLRLALAGATSPSLQASISNTGNV